MRLGNSSSAIARALRWSPPLAIIWSVCACSLWNDLTSSHTNGTGQPTILWRVPAAAAAPSDPAFDGTTAYFLDNSHEVVAIDGRSGIKRWTSSTGTVGGGTYTDGGCVMAASVVTCGDDDLIGLRPSDGTVLWRYHATVGYSPGYFPQVAVGTTVYAGSPSGTVYAVDATSGAARWVVKPFPADTEGISIFDPSADSGIVVAGFTKFLVTKPSIGGVVALDAGTGQVRWIAYFPQPDSTIGTNARSTVLWQDIVLAPSNSGGVIYAFDRTTGAVQWTLPGVGTGPPQFPGSFSQDLRNLTISGSTLFAASLSDWLVAYSLPDRSELCRVASPSGSADPRRIVTDGQFVYVGLVNGQLVSYSVAKPGVAWEIGESPNGFFGTVAIGTDRIFAVRQDGFYALAK